MKHDDESTSESPSAAAIADLLGGLHRAKAGRRSPVVEGESLGGLMTAWAAIGAQFLRRAITLGAELGSATFDRQFAAGRATVDELEIREPLRLHRDRGTFRVRNRRHGYVELHAPAVVEFHSADGKDRQLVKVALEPAESILGPGEERELALILAETEHLTRPRYIGWVEFATPDGGRCSLAVEYSRGSGT